MTSRPRLIPLLGLLLLAACDRGGEQAGQAGAPVVQGEVPANAQDTERTWAGLLPCRDCQGVDTRLVLRTDRGQRNYVMTETYVGGAGKNSFNRAGSWTEIQRRVGDQQEVIYVLDPDQSAQRYVLQPDGALELIEADGRSPQDPIAYRLQRL